MAVNPTCPCGVNHNIMAVNVRLKKRFKRSNVKDRKAYYFPSAVSAHKALEPGTEVICQDNAKGIKPKLVTVVRAKDAAMRVYTPTFVVFLEDLCE